MSLYAQNLIPIAATNISWSLIVIGREFQSPINFFTDCNCILTSNPVRVTNYASDQARLLSCPCAISRKFIHHHCVYHREYTNSCRPNSHLYSEGDMVFSKSAIKFEKRRGLVGKLMDYFTGHWRVTKRLHSNYYKLVHRDTNRPGKRHVAHLSPLPQELTPFQTVDGSNNRFEQCMPLSKRTHIRTL